MNQQLVAKLALLLATLIWGSSFIIMKDALDDITTYYLLAIRFTGAFVLSRFVEVHSHRSTSTLSDIHHSYTTLDNLA